MKAISVSTDVFAMIWSLRVQGEETEDAILSRVLRAAASGQSEGKPPSSHLTVGFHDTRHGVIFPTGFEIFRTFKGRKFVARAEDGRWILADSSQRYSSLNELSRAIGAGTENAWVNWFFLDAGGQRKSVSSLRDQDRITARVRNTENLREEAVSDEFDGRTWRDDVFRALGNLGGRAPLDQIYKEVEGLRREGLRTLPRHLDAIVRRTLEESSSDSDSYKGGPNLFKMSNGKGGGVWELN